MSKIICDICGTTYQDTAECCPICGCSRDAAADLLGDHLLTEEVVEEPKGKGGRFSPKKKKEIFDFDEVNAEPEEEPEEEENPYDEEEEEEETPRHNTFVVILLTILIAGLLLAAGFIFFRYFLPNMGGNEAAVSTEAQQIEETAGIATEPTIPCEALSLVSGGVAELDVGGQFLLHVIATPENTTDKIIYTSADENIATVTEDGKITAVSEGETIIYISCGMHSFECKVVVQTVIETEPPTTEAPVAETVAETAAEAPTETEAPEPSIKSGVTLKLKKTDIMLGVYYQFQLLLDCDLEQNEVEWSSEHPHIATVDENGVVTAVKSGTTAITAKYGDQEVQCIVRCG